MRLLESFSLIGYKRNKIKANSLHVTHVPNETRMVKSLEHHSVSFSFQTFEVANKASLLAGGCKQRAEYTVWKC